MFGTRCRIKMFNRLSCFPGFILRPWCNILASLLPVVVVVFFQNWYLLWTVPVGIYLFLRVSPGLHSLCGCLLFQAVIMCSAVYTTMCAAQILAELVADLR